MLTPGSPIFTQLRDLDGPLPPIHPVDFDAWLTHLGMERTKPAPEAETQETGKGLDRYAHGMTWGHRLRQHWCYDHHAGGYHQWDGSRWLNHASREYAQDLMWREIMDGEAESMKTLIQGHGRRDVLRGVDAVIDRSLQRLMVDQLAVANGVVDLRATKLMDFDPVRDTQRVLTGGAYQSEWADEHCMNVLRARFWPGGVRLLDDQGIRMLAQYVGLAITGNSQRHHPILFLWGESGAGKGGALSLINSTLGERAMGTTMGALTGRGEIDATQAAALLNDTLMITISEPQAVDQADFLARTGDNEVSKRFPHGLLIKGRPRSMYVVAAVEPPTLDLAAGFWRRTGVIKFPDHATAAGEEIIKHGYRDDPTQEQQDALLTLAVRAAAQVYRSDYSPTKGNDEAPETVP